MDTRNDFSRQYADPSAVLRPPALAPPARPAHLTAQAAAVDRDALFAQFSPLVRRLINQYGKTPELRQDLVGEFYCRFHDLLDRYDPSRGIPLNAYLVRQLSLCAYTFARKQRRQADHETPLLEEAIDHNEPDPTQQWDTTLLEAQVAARLPCLIGSLPLRHRQVLICRYYEERSFEEIGQLLQIRACSARSLLRHALNRLRAQTVGGGDCECGVSCYRERAQAVPLKAQAVPLNRKAFMNSSA